MNNRGLFIGTVHNVCVMCMRSSEIHDHPFLHCPVAWGLWSYLFAVYPKSGFLSVQFRTCAQSLGVQGMQIICGVVRCLV